jgi:hypothetical protein
MQEQPMLQRLLGWKQPVVLAPGQYLVSSLWSIKFLRSFQR